MYQPSGEQTAAAGTPVPWETAIDSLPELIFVVDLQGRVVRANRTLETWLGDVPEVTGVSLHPLLHPACSDPDCYLIRHLYRTVHPSAQGLEPEQVFDRQLQRRLRLHGRLLRPGADHPRTAQPLVMLVFEDLSLADVVGTGAAGTEPLRQLVEGAPDLILRQTADGRLLYLSPVSIPLLGLAPAQLVGTRLLTLVHPDDRASIRQTLGALGELGELASVACRLHHADGGYRWVEFNSRRLHQAPRDGEVVSVVRDIAVRKAAEESAAQYQRQLEDAVAAGRQQLELVIDMLQRKIEANERDRAALAASERRYTMLVENTLTGIYMCEGSRLVFCNDRFARIFGYRQEEMATMDLASLGVVLAEEMLECDIGHEETIEAVARDGARKWLKLSRARFTCGASVFVLGNVIDVTEQVGAQERLQASEHELRVLSAQLLATQENERKRIANELHDGLGQRLSAIKFAVEDVLRTEAEQGRLAQAERLGTIVERIRDAIEEIRRVSMDLRPSILDDLGLVATLGWLCREFGQVCQGIRIDKQIDVSEADIAEPLKVVIFRITQEALHNIAKHANADRVHIGLARSGDGLQLTIRDNGIGFDYARAVAVEAGLGLKSMHERAELTGGRFSVRSDSQAGTEISVLWPPSA